MAEKSVYAKAYLLAGISVVVNESETKLGDFSTVEKMHYGVERSSLSNGGSPCLAMEEALFRI